MMQSVWPFWTLGKFSQFIISAQLQDHRIRIESETHGDILQERFEDSYLNLTIKTMLLLKYYNQNCSHIPYMLKADDDVFLNTKNLYRQVVQNTKDDLLIGYLFCDKKPIRVQESTWYIPESVYSKETYPQHLNGPGYLMSLSTAHKLLRTARDVPLFMYEDVYTTGILAKAAGIQCSFLKVTFQPTTLKFSPSRGFDDPVMDITFIYNWKHIQSISITNKHLLIG